MENSQINITEIISQSINSLFSSLFSSIDTNIYSTLDDLTFVDSDIINSNNFLNIFGLSSKSGILLIANSLLISFLLLYCIRFFCSSFTSSNIEQPFQFIFKFIIIMFLINFSYFICEQLININSLISSSIREVGENIFNCNINFTELINKINSLLFLNLSDFNIFSFDGIIKSFISVSLFNLLFTYSLRYIMIKVFCLLTPFAFLFLINSSTSFLFKSWLKSFFCLLILQSFISIILLIIFSLEINSNDLFSKLLYIGAIYALTKSNYFIKAIIGGISTDISSNFNILKSFFNI